MNLDRNIDSDKTVDTATERKETTWRITRKPWKLEEDLELEKLLNWGPVANSEIVALAKRLGRTKVAVVCRAQRLGYKQLRRKPNYVTVASLARETGYNETRIRVVLVRLKIYTRTMGRRSDGKPIYSAIMTTDVPRILEELKRTSHKVLLCTADRGAWGVKGRYYRIPPVCMGCHSSERPHHAGGRCQKCYESYSQLMRPKITCPNCQGTTRPMHAKGVCRACYYKMRKEPTVSSK